MRGTLLHNSMRGIHLVNPDGLIGSMPKPSAPRYRTTNRSTYNASLLKRGSLSVWFDPDMVWHAQRSGRQGRPGTFSGEEERTAPA